VGGAIAQGQFTPAPGATNSPANQILLAAASRIHAQSAAEQPREKGAKEKVKTAPTGPARPDVLSLDSSTVSGNLAAFGGGLFNQQGRVLTVHDSIVAGNAGPAGVSNCSPAVTSQGYNLENAADCNFTALGDLRNAKAGLAALSDNGGPTQTMAVGAGSPAIAAGDPACLAPAVDQRGVSRPQGGRCDIGAFEAVITTPMAVAPTRGLPRPPVTGRAPMVSVPATHPPPLVPLDVVASLATILALALGVPRRRRQDR
jgi:hypothetical protein